MRWVSAAAKRNLRTKRILLKRAGFADRCLRLGSNGSGFERLCLRLRLGGQLLPIAAFLDAGMNGADLGFLFDDKRSATLRAGLVYRHIRCCEIAIRIARATVE